MSPLRVLTVDDELLALKRLKLLLQAMPHVDHVGEASDCANALARIRELQPNVVLLDIKMRDGNGFDVVEALAERPNPPAIVFVTAFDEFAAQAFDSAVELLPQLLEGSRQRELYRSPVGGQLDQILLNDGIKPAFEGTDPQEALDTANENAQAEIDNF